MSEGEVMAYTVKLPIKHAQDWHERSDEHADRVEIVARTARTITLTLDNDALCDLISDALYYAEEMSPDNTGDIDYRPAARRCLAAIERAGINYSRRGFRITLEAANRTR